MTTYSELMAQAQALMAQAEQARRSEISGVITEIRAKMREYGLTADDLAVGRIYARKSGAGAQSKPKAPAKYRGPNGELWAGGPGRKPAWVAAALAEGYTMDDFLIEKPADAQEA